MTEEDIEVDLSIYDTDLDDHDQDERSFTGTTVVPSVDTSSLTEDERWDRMFQLSIEQYERILIDQELSPDKKLKVVDTLMEMYGKKGNKRTEKIYQLTFSTDYMENLKTSYKLFKEMLDEPISDV